mmetsp:Transcript_32240/g.69675  ORF Transcript_32240/g.69675 Transcript_32240/m.69675 type:complete len:137 (+) Transcript_32240:392-802(+)
MGVKDMMNKFAGNGGVTNPDAFVKDKKNAEMTVAEAQKKAKETAKNFRAPTDLVAANKKKGAWQKEKRKSSLAKRLSQKLGLTKAEPEEVVEEEVAEAEPEEEVVEEEPEAEEEEAAEEEAAEDEVEEEAEAEEEE